MKKFLPTLSCVTMLLLGYSGHALSTPQVTGKGVLPIVDQQGRQLILQGLNSGNVAKHSEMRRSWETETDVAYQAKTMGYNTARYLIFWDLLMPQRGQINQDYLDDIEARLEWYTDNKMQVILDMHQDVWGENCGGNGAPGWASIGSDDPLNEGPWWLKVASPCAVDSANNFFANVGNIQDDFSLAWRAVAERFAGHPAVIGYDLFNEPTRLDAIADQLVYEMIEPSQKGLLNFAVIGTVWVDGHPYNMFTGLIRNIIRDLAANMGFDVPESYIDKVAHTLIARNKGDWGNLNAVREFEGGALSDLYQKVINRIREVDNDHYIFVEPMSVSANHGAPTALRYLHDPRNGERRLGYMPHLYPRDLHEGASYRESDFSRVNLWETNQHNYAYNNNMAWLMGEFGHSNSAEGGLQYLKDVMLMAERNKLGWAYWSSDPGGWSPIAPDKVSELRNAQALVNIYPRAVAGSIENYDFDAMQNTFTLSYRNSGATGTTEIALPQRFYAGEFTVSSSTDSNWQYQLDSEHNILHISHDQDVDFHQFAITATGGDQPMPYRELISRNNGKCLDFSGTLPSAGKSAILWQCEGKSWQRWTYDSKEQFLRSFQNPEYCLSHGGPEQAKDGGVVTLALCSDSNDHRWHYNDGVFANAHNPDYVLDAFGTDNNSTIGQWLYHGGKNQKWDWAQTTDLSMQTLLGGMKKDQRYFMKISTREHNCRLEWDGELESDNERNAKFDCSSQGDGFVFTAASEPQKHSDNSVSVAGYLSIANGNCALEWDAHLDNKNERNSKFDCSTSGDQITLTSTSGGSSLVVSANQCGLEWDAKLKNGERNAKFDCSPGFDEMQLEQFRVY
ncbi:cellulase family glycosylhydrolase [Thalassomonas actiniarum]|uniref:Cellulase family glycosylhydrolase n=1 Tax=Thalassomonas actiniarum TaxID=485447 RepID=A0AAF0C470_9GAMM|nr:cellulase family glycosylhydrolase [Thalassomonas actiniarum]WDD99685.1 cellulase family glycosylhydrolase [Thalassomonas actiniarum]